METKIYSLCCGAEANGHSIDYGLCPECKDHCTFVDEGVEELREGGAYDVDEIYIITGNCNGKHPHRVDSISGNNIYWSDYFIGKYFTKIGEL